MPVFTNTTKPPPPPQVTTDCGVWMAPSTIPGAGMGLFAGRNFRSGNTVTPGDAAIPLIDLPFHNDVPEFDDFQFLWDEYTWSAGSFTGMEEESEDVYGASFGVGALPNCLFTQVSVDETYTLLDGAGLHRSRDPGAGAFTPYHDRVGVAARNVYAGEELFVDYGFDYFAGRREETFGKIPFVEDFTDAYQTWSYFLDLRYDVHERHLHQKRQRQGSTNEETLETIFLDLYQLVIDDIAKIWPSRILSALPGPDFLHNPDLEELMSQHGLEVILEERSQRTIEDIHQQGACLDHLRANTSTIPQAGRGAFVIHDIPAGHVIAPMPLIHIPNRDILTMYLGFHTQTGHYKRNITAPIHSQLLLNYCFGHKESSLLLCPYGVVSSLINHASSKKRKSKYKPNARLAWSPQMSRYYEWLNQPIDDWAYNYTAGLAFDLIATRDIEAGEEILIDYGDAWERAWQKHVRSFVPKSPDYIAANELEELHVDVLPVDLPSNIELRCHEYYRLFQGLPAEKDRELHRCRVVQRQHPSGRYVAEIVAAMDRPAQQECYIKVKEVLWDLPRDGFALQDVPYSRDHAQPWAFRHALGIPDELLPDVWRNRLKEKKKR